MLLHMSGPYKNPKTGVYYFRQKTPADLRKVFGKWEAIRSLHTKDPDLARQAVKREMPRKKQTLEPGYTTDEAIKLLRAALRI
jgi:hypothetical protein